VRAIPEGGLSLSLARSGSFSSTSGSPSARHAEELAFDFHFRRQRIDNARADSREILSQTANGKELLLKLNRDGNGNSRGTEISARSKVLPISAPTSRLHEERRKSGS
jgi:hypothetical protein